MPRSLFSFTSSRATSTSSSLYSTCFSTREYFFFCVSSSITWIISLKRGFAIPFTRTAIHLASVLFKFLALLFGTNPISWITSMIMFFVS